MKDINTVFTKTNIGSRGWLRVTEFRLGRLQMRSGRMSVEK